MLTKSEFSEKLMKLAPFVCEELELREVGSEAFITILMEMAAVFDSKQHDYGPDNIGAFGTFGVVVRMNDKMERLKNVLGRKRGKVKNETIRDSLLDLANYAIIALMVEKGVWPKS